MKKKNKTVITYSALKKYQQCQLSYKYRYIDWLVPLQENKNLWFGSIIHNCLEKWHNGECLPTINEYILTANEGNKANELLTFAMVHGYIEKYSTENFEIIELEKVFEGAITNPATGRNSYKFTMSGKLDGIVKRNNEYWLLEHKTAANVDGNYIDRLWNDLQIALYCHYMKEALGYEPKGIIYNILIKAKLKQSEGETEEEYESRKEILIKKSVKGKTSAKRRMPESDSEFYARLLEKYKTGDMFQRQEIIVTANMIKAAQKEIWSTLQALKFSVQTNNFYKNQSQCFGFGKCAYWDICDSGGSQNIIDNFYRIEEPNVELRERKK